MSSFWQCVAVSLTTCSSRRVILLSPVHRRIPKGVQETGSQHLQKHVSGSAHGSKVDFVHSAFCDPGWEIVEKCSVKTGPVYSSQEELLRKQWPLACLMLKTYFLPISLYAGINLQMFNASEKNEPERQRAHHEFAVGHAMMMWGGVCRGGFRVTLSCWSKLLATTQ